MDLSPHSRGSPRISERSERSITSSSAQFIQQLDVALQQMQYPEPATRWKEEVQSLQKKVHNLKKTEKDLMRRTGKSRATASAKAVNELEKMGHQYSVTHVGQVESLIALSDQRCEALAQILQIQAKQTGPVTPPAPSYDVSESARRIHGLEEAVRKLELENHELRMRYGSEEKERTRRENDLKHLCKDQLGEIQRLQESLGHQTADVTERGSTLDFPSIGLHVSDFISTTNQGINAVNQSGVRVMHVYGPAQRAGVKIGDFIIWAVTSMRVTDKNDFRTAVGRTRLKDTVSLVLKRRDEEISFDIEVGPNVTTSPAPAMKPTTKGKYVTSKPLNK